MIGPGSSGPADRKPAIDELLAQADASRCLAPFVAGGVEGLGLYRDDGPVHAVASRPGGMLTRWDTLPAEALAALRRGGERSFGIEGAAKESLRVEVRHSEATYELLEGEPMDVFHIDEPVRLEVGQPETRPWTAPKAGPEPRQPPGRAPTRRRRR